MKKYRACVTALSEEQRAAREALARASAAEDEARTARERVAELTARLASADNATTAGQAAQNDKFVFSFNIFILFSLLTLIYLNYYCIISG